MLAVACACAGTLVCAGEARASGLGWRTVRYHGTSVGIPRSWPVFDLSRKPGTCVRFDRHALYLGVPGREERCPAHAAGRTEAILISPLAGDGAPRPHAAGLGLEGDVTSFPLLRARVEVTATWRLEPGVVARALGRRSLPRAVGIAGATKTGATTPEGSGGTRGRGFTMDIYRGRGFDTCTAPSPSQMSAWSSSPYHALGIYIGGVNSSCAQPNLTAGWVHNEIAAGWRFFPYYVGPQAPGTNCGGCVIISSSGASAEGTAAAKDAVSRAGALGMGPGSPIYYDMEGHTDTSSSRAVVRAFASAWTRQMHAHGYMSGFYGSAFSTMRDIASGYHTRFPEPDYISIADWNGRATTSDPYMRPDYWAHHQRLHQYDGPQNQTHGGVTLNIDPDVLNGAVVYKRPAPGYLVLTSDGGVRAFGGSAWHGSDLGRLGKRVRAVALATDRSTGGYWILRSDGGVNAFHAPWHGSLRGRLHGLRPVALAPGRAGGYLVLTSNGGIYRFGRAVSHGSDAGKLPTRVRAVSLAVDRSTGGYWILRSDGGVDAFAAPSYGSLEGRLGHARPVALATTRRGGYLILTANGTVHFFGPGTSQRSYPDKRAARLGAVALATRPTAAGYWMLRSDGGVSGFHAPWYGSPNGTLPVGERPAAIAAAGS